MSTYASREAAARLEAQEILASLAGPQKPLDWRDASADVAEPDLTVSPIDDDYFSALMDDREQAWRAGGSG
jgi:hypothetical protein